MKKMNERKKNPGRFLMVFLMMALMMFGATAVSAASQDRETVQFRDGNGNPAAGIPDMVIEEGETIVLPDVPAEKKRAVQGTPSWKTTLHVSEETQYFEPGEEMSCETAKDWIAEQGGGNVLKYVPSAILQMTVQNRLEKTSPLMRERKLHFINLRTRITSCTEAGANIKKEPEYGQVSESPILWTRTEACIL